MTLYRRERFECPYHKGEVFNSVYDLAKHIDSVIEKIEMNWVSPSKEEGAKTFPRDVSARSKKKEKREYAPNLDEVNMGAASPSAYDGSDSGNIYGIQDFRNNTPATIDDGSKRLRRASVPKKHKVWVRHYQGATSYPSAGEYSSPVIPAIKGKLEEYIIEYYDSVIDSIDKSFQPIDADIKLKDDMVEWLYNIMEKQINAWGLDNALELATQMRYLSNFREQIIRKQLDKQVMLMRLKI